MAVSYFIILIVSSAKLLEVFGQTCDPPCGVQAVCSGSECQCAAPTNQGNPYLFCHMNDQDSCFTISDPQLSGFSHGFNRLKFPCRYTLAHFDTVLQGQAVKRFANSDPTNNRHLQRYRGRKNCRGRCRFVILGTNALSAGTYYVEYVDVTIKIKNMNTVETITVHLDGDTATYSIDGGADQSVALGASESVTVSQRTVTISGDSATKLWTVEALSCGTTRVVFRAFHHSAGPSGSAGVGIITQDNSFFNGADTGYPVAMCDKAPPSGSDTVYRDYFLGLGLSNRYISALYAFLSNPPSAGQPADQPACTDAINTFNACPNQVDAVNACGVIAVDFSHCAEQNGGTTMAAFEKCLEGFCTSNQALCDEASGMITPACPGAPSFTCS